MRTTKGTQCYAFNCNNYRNKETKEKGLSFHKFPNQEKEKERYQVWLRNCRRDRPPGNGSVLCSKHFSEEWINRTGQIVQLREGAIPTIFDFPEHLQPVPPKERNTHTSQRAMEELEPNDEPTFNEEHLNAQASVSADHAYHASPLKWKRKLYDTEEKLEEVSKKFKNAVKREKRAKATCKRQVEQLYEQNFINMELKRKLQSFGDMPWELFKRETREYETDQRDFAVSLHLQSPKGYEFLRSTGFPLPHPRTLRRWMESVDGSPGINESMLQVLVDKKKKFPGEYTKCCLMLDAMSIRKQVEFNQHSNKFTGYVDLGNGAEEGRDASEALVFMLVGLNGQWKAPVAYFFTNVLTAETQKELVVHCLERLYELGFLVHAITMDGHATNMAMCALLGAELDPRSEQYKVCIRPVEGQMHDTYIVPDVCHMIKLVRNTWHALSGLRSDDGMICWKLVNDLHRSQEEAGLTMANKLTSKHLNFYQQKMKVRLAVQVLSKSVATAFRAMKQLGDDRFKDCEATASFLERHVCEGPRGGH